MLDGAGKTTVGGLMKNPIDAGKSPLPIFTPADVTEDKLGSSAIPAVPSDG
jgi:hypothetical protein